MFIIVLLKINKIATYIHFLLNTIYFITLYSHEMYLL